MKFQQIFEDAQWIAASDFNKCPVLYQKFTVKGSPRSAELRILGFGTFEAYLNGKRVGDEWFQPLSTDYEQRQWAPVGEQTAFRTIVPHYPVADLLVPGENVLTVILGNGWYSFPTDWKKTYGGMKAAWRLAYGDDEGDHRIYSATDSVVWQDSFVKKSELIRGEDHDYNGWDEKLMLPGADLSGLEHVVPAPAPESNFEYSDCPADKVVRKITPTVVSTDAQGTLYDIGINTSGVPVLHFEKGDTSLVELSFSEELKDGALDPFHTGRQSASTVNDGKERDDWMRYTWIACRYIYVKGSAKLVSFWQIHTAVQPAADFTSDNETLNWIWQAYQNTQLSNMHRGIPSDCPHLERRGYTGDGQLVCRASMKMLAAKDFYEKWINDISDCQDRISGHVQYTAPYIKSGGGPGGWGGAIVFVPLAFWEIYGDDQFLAPMYPQMLEYFRYLEAHSEYGLVTSDKAGEWCLGDWCTPDLIALPAPFVNNYFYVKALEGAIKVAKHIGREADIPMMLERINYRRSVTRAAYMNPFDGNFIGNRQGANGFALDMGIGDERTKKNFIEHYQADPYYDTGIFGTEIITRLLFEYGEAETAVAVLTADAPHGFGAWRKWGCTTLWEYWVVSRSHSHPMFGAVTENLLTEILGIKQTANSRGFTSVVIQPKLVPQVNQAQGYVTTAYGKLSVAFTKKDGQVTYTIDVPAGLSATLIWGEEHKDDQLTVLKAGVNVVTAACSC